jgi:hypothetical protein
MREMRNAYCILVGKPDRNRLLGRPWYRQKYDMKLNLKYDWKVCSRITCLGIKASSGSDIYGN